MNNFFQSFGQLFASFGLIFTSILGHVHPAVSTPSQPTKTVQVAPNGSTYNVSRKFSYQGYSITMSAAIPKEGGNVTGTISGDCSGTITGKYDGKDNGTISGKSQMNCSLAIIQIPGTVTFNGTVNKTAKNAQLLVMLDVSSFKKSQQVTLNFN